MAAHAPRAAADLVMHKKKVEEVRGWLALQDTPPNQAPRAPRLLLLTGMPCTSCPPFHQRLKCTWAAARGSSSAWSSIPSRS